jgi:hypothetical protein
VQRTCWIQLGRPAEVLDLYPENDVAGACAFDGLQVVADGIDEDLRVAHGRCCGGWVWSMRDVVDGFALVLAPRLSPHLPRFTCGHAKLFARSAGINVFSLFQTPFLHTSAYGRVTPRAPRCIICSEPS